MTTSNALGQIFESVGRCLTSDVATKLGELRISDELQTQLDLWGDKNSLGSLEADEREQYEAILRALNFVAVLQAKARRIATEAK